MTQWTKDPKAEAVLRELKLPIKTETVDLKKIDWKLASENFGRLGRPLVSDTVEDYGLAMLEGHVFPMTVFARHTANGRVTALYPLAGLHRSSAAREAGDGEIPAYIVENPLEHQERLIAGMTNRREGMRLNKSEAVEYAVHLVTECKIPAADAAKRLGVSAAYIHQRVRDDRVRKQAAEVGFRGTLGPTIVRLLHRVAGNDKVLLATTQACHSHKLNEREADALTKTVAAQRTEAKQLAYLDEFQKSRQVELAPHSPVRLSVRGKFLRQLHALRTAIAGAERIEDLQIQRGSDDHKNIQKEWADLKKEITRLMR